MNNIKLIPLLLFVAISFFVTSCDNEPKDEEIRSQTEDPAMDNENNIAKIYDYEVTTIDGEKLRLDAYKGKVMLIVNVASKCGYTPQYEGLQKLYENYKDKGLVVLGFPSNQFGAQEPGNSEDIKEFCSANYGVNFPMFEKVDVNGENAHPLYQYIKKEKPDSGTTDIKWNFTKFLVDRNGRVIQRYAPQIEPEQIEPELKKYLDS